MKAVRTERSNVNYRGPSDDVGDLWCERVAPGEIHTTWDLTDYERHIIAEGGVVELAILGEPIPPVSLIVKMRSRAKIVGDNAYRNDFPELPDPRP